MDINAYMEDLNKMPTDDQIRKVRNDLLDGTLEFDLTGPIEDWVVQNKDRILELAANDSL